MAASPTHDRQRLLPEVGAAGQARIDRTRLYIPQHVEGQIAAMARLYGGAAGLDLGSGEPPEPNADSSGPSRPGVVPSERLPHATPLEAFFRHTTSRTIGLGAHLALCSVRAALSSPSQAGEPS